MKRILRAVGLVGTVLAVIGGLALLWPQQPAVTALADAVHTVSRAAVRADALAHVSGQPQMLTPHFRIYYPQGDAADAALVAQQAEKAYPFVFGMLGGTPPGRIPIVVETRDGFAQLLGQPARQDPLGAYWQGVVWLLTPSAYLPGSAASRAAAFASTGPAAHELTHLADDRLTGGRMPAWLDEGVAQYVQWQFNGYQWLEPDNTFCQPLYTWSQLTGGFDGLGNQALAYRQAFAVVQKIAASGPDALQRLIASIGSGHPTSSALAAAVGPKLAAALASGSAWTCGGGAPAGPATAASGS